MIIKYETKTTSSGNPQKGSAFYKKYSPLTLEMLQITRKFTIVKFFERSQVLLALNILNSKFDNEIIVLNKKLIK